MRKVEKSRDSRQNRENRELGPAWGVEGQLLIPSSCLSPGRVKEFQSFLRVDVCKYRPEVAKITFLKNSKKIM